MTMSAFFERGLKVVAFYAIAGASLAGCSTASGSTTPTVSASLSSRQLTAFKQKINHIIIIYQENWGFDSLYGNFPGVNGYANATSINSQVDLSGNPIAKIGQVLNGGKPDPQFAGLDPSGAVAPFDLATYIPTTAFTDDPNHNFYLQQVQIDGGRMDKYLADPADNKGALSFGYFDTTNMPEGKLAQQYTIADNFHQSSFGGSFLNNMYAACACTPQIPLSAIPPGKVEPVDANGDPTVIGGKEGRATPDGFLVNTAYTTQYPQIVNFTTSNVFVPPLLNPTLGDRLTAANVPWKFYAGGLNNALAGTADPNFQPHHQSYLYFANYAPGQVGAAHIVDDSNFLTDLKSNSLPAVSWVKPIGDNNEHPGYANIAQGQMFVANLVSQIQMSPAWKDTLVVIFYDEAGGHYDHAAPLPVDRFGPSTRVPAIFISPFAKRGFVDHSNYEVTSILKTIELRYDLAPLTARDDGATPLLAPFDFTQSTPAAFARQSLGTLPRIAVMHTVSAGTSGAIDHDE